MRRYLSTISAVALLIVIPAGSSFAGSLDSISISRAVYGVCKGELLPLRDDVMERLGSIRSAYRHRARPEDTCRSVQNLNFAETKLIVFLERNKTRCGVADGVAEDLKVSHNGTVAEFERVCGVGRLRLFSGTAIDVNDHR